MQFIQYPEWLYQIVINWVNTIFDWRISLYSQGCMHYLKWMSEINQQRRRKTEMVVS